MMMFTYRICLTEEPPLRRGRDDIIEGWCYPHSLGSRFVLAAAEAWDGYGDPPNDSIRRS